jgi:iron complex outermembrane recepter protein
MLEKLKAASEDGWRPLRVYGAAFSHMTCSGMLRALIGIAALQALSAGHAHADTALPATTQLLEHEALEEVIVTARRVSENLQTTGAAITAFSGQELYDLNVTTEGQLAKYVPNLELKANAGSAADGLVIKIRGIGVSDVDFLNADPSVATYVDGVFQARPFGAQFDLIDLESVEVLRGPQGTLYGKNALGGAINIVTHKPDGRESAEVDATGGNYGTSNFTGRAQTSLVSDILFASLAVMSRTHDAYYKNLYQRGEDPGNEDRQAARLALRWLPGSAVKVDLVADYTRQQQHAQPNIATIFAPTGLAASGLRAAGLNPNTYAVGANPSWNALANVYLDNGANGGSFLPPGYGGSGRSIDDATFKTVAATIEVELSPSITIRSISGYQTFDRFLADDGDGTPAAIIDELDITNGRQFTQELQLNADFFDKHLKLTAGGFFLHEKLYEDESNGFLTGLAETEPSLQNLSSRNVHDFTNQSEAAFTHASWALTDETSLVGGIRYTREAKTAIYQVGPLITPNVFSTLDERQPLHFSAVTPLLELEHKLTNDMFGYFSASKGYSSGGFNDTPSALTGRIATYGPETLWSYEAGLKTEFLERRLRLNIAAFLMNYDNVVIQSYGVSPTNGGIGLETTNGGRARVKGAEAEMQWRVTQSLKATASYGELNQRFLDFGIGANGTPIDPASAHFFDSPAETESFRVSYTLPVAASMGRFETSADLSHRDRTWFDNNNTPVSSQRAYGLLDARIQYTSLSGRLSLMAFGENLTDRAYMVRSLDGLVTPFAFAVALYGQPRTFGARINYKL